MSKPTACRVLARIGCQLIGAYLLTGTAWCATANEQSPPADPREFRPSDAKGPQGRTWASIGKLPDWQGAWGLDEESFAVVRHTSDTTGAARIPPFNAKYAAIHDENVRVRRGGEAAGNNSAHCLPDGMPNIMSAAFAFEFLFTPGKVTIIPENNEVRRIRTDGSGHPDDVDDSWEGDSIGYWRGKTLVIDTIGLNGRSELFVGVKASKATHVVEEIHRKDHETMEIDTTVYNADMFTRPYVYSRTFKLSPYGMIQAFCTENNRDNNTSVDLTPPESSAP